MRKCKRLYAITEIREITRHNYEKKIPFLNFTRSLQLLNRPDSRACHLSGEIFSHISFLAIMKMHSWHFPLGCGDRFDCLRPPRKRQRQDLIKKKIIINHCVSIRLAVIIFKQGCCLRVCESTGAINRTQIRFIGPNHCNINMHSREL